MFCRDGCSRYEIVYFSGFIRVIRIAASRRIFADPLQILQWKVLTGGLTMKTFSRSSPVLICLLPSSPLSPPLIISFVRVQNKLCQINFKDLLFEFAIKDGLKIRLNWFGRPLARPWKENMKLDPVFPWKFQIERILLDSHLSANTKHLTVLTLGKILTYES